MSDPYQGIFAGMDGPYVNGASVTPDDGNDLPNYARALWIGAAGNVTVTLRNSTTPITVPVAASSTNNEPAKLYVKRVWATGTTATGIIALW